MSWYQALFNSSQIPASSFAVSIDNFTIVYNPLSQLEVGTVPGSKIQLDTDINLGTGELKSSQIEITSNGSSSNAAIQRQGDPDTGIYFSNPDEVSITAGGVQSLIFFPTQTTTNNNIVPNIDNIFRLGSSSNRFSEIFVNSLRLLSTTGDILYASAASTISRLPIGSTGQILTVSGGLPIWQTPTSGVISITSTSLNRILVNGGLGPATGAITLDLPQDIALTSNPTFSSATNTTSTFTIGTSSGTSTSIVKAINVLSTGFARINIFGDEANTAGEPGGAGIVMGNDNRATTGSIAMNNLVNTDGVGNACTNTAQNCLTLNVYNNDINFAIASDTKYKMNSTAIYPSITATYDLGTNSLRFRDLYLSGNITASNIVNSVAGTTNEILINGGTAPTTGAITVSLPSDVITTSYTADALSSAAFPSFAWQNTLFPSSLSQGFFSDLSGPGGTGRIVAVVNGNSTSRTGIYEFEKVALGEISGTNPTYCPTIATSNTRNSSSWNTSQMVSRLVFRSSDGNVSSGELFSITTFPNNATLSEWNTEFSCNNNRYFSLKAAPVNTIEFDLQLRGINGTATNPTYSFTSATNAGLYLVGTNNVGITTGGVLRFDVNNTRTRIAGNLEPDAALTRNLGSSTLYWLQAYAETVNLTNIVLTGTTVPNASAIQTDGSGGWQIGTNGITRMTIPFTGDKIVLSSADLEPLVSGNENIGSSTKRFGEGYFESLDIGGVLTIPLFNCECINIATSTVCVFIGNNDVNVYTTFRPNRNYRLIGFTTTTDADASTATITLSITGSATISGTTVSMTASQSRYTAFSSTLDVSNTDTITATATATYSSGTGREAIFTIWARYII